MAQRPYNSQSLHDSAVYAAQNIYQQYGMHAWVNPGSEKNHPWNGRYIDVIATVNQAADRAWVIEVETADSVSQTEAACQWVDYSSVYSTWYLAVPITETEKARQLLSRNGIQNCIVISWEVNTNGTITYRGLPGLKAAHRVGT